AGIRYRYYASLPHLKGESKTTSVGSVSRISATDIENVVINSVKEHLAAQRGEPSASNEYGEDRSLIAEQVVRVDVHKKCLVLRLNVVGQEEAHPTDGELITIPWVKPPSRKSRQILIPLGASQSEVR